MWSTFFREGGFFMYPIAAFGLILVACAFLFVFRPGWRLLSMVASAWLLTETAGLLGTSLGLINTFRYLGRVAAEDQLRIAALGCAESLNNVVLALILGTLAALLAWVGTVRMSLRRAAE